MRKLRYNLKDGTSAEWNRSSDTGAAWSGYLLRQGELGIEIFNDNTTKFKIGNGIDVWSKLPYVSSEVGKFVESLPQVQNAIPYSFYIMGEDIYYTPDNKTWVQLARGARDFDELNNRPKYNSTEMTHSTNIPKVPTTASEIEYSGKNSGISAVDVQNAIDELSATAKNKISKLTTPEIVYTNDSVGNIAGIAYSSTKSVNTMARRTSTGTLKAQDPIENDDLVTRQYHDNDVNPVKLRVSALETTTESLGNRTTNLESNLDTVEQNVTTNTDNITNLTNRMDNTETNVSNLTTNVNSLSIRTNTLEDTTTKIQDDITKNEETIKEIDQKIDKEIEDRQNGEIEKFEAGLGSNKTTLTITKKNGEALSANLTIASPTQNGLMPSSTFSQITQNTEDIALLKQRGGNYIGVSFETYQQLLEYVIPSTVNIGDWTFVNNDETHDDNLTEYIYNGTSFDYAFTIEVDPIGFATLGTPGIVLGSETAGQIFVEQDGTMSLNGYDNILTELDNRVSKEDGKQLSTNDYDNTDKAKVDRLKVDGNGDYFLGDDGDYHQINIPDVPVQDVQVEQQSIVDELGVVNLATLAVTGSWDDIKNIPNDLVRDATYVHTDNNYTTDDKNKVDLIQIEGTGSKVLTDAGVYTRLADVAGTGSYLDLVDVPEGLVEDIDYNHTDNNFTDELKERLLNIKDNGQINTIESISVNGDQLPIDNNKNVDIDLSGYVTEEEIPTKISDLTNDNGTVQDLDYVHTDENFTTELKEKLDSLQEGGEANKLEIVKVDGVPLLIDETDKSVDIPLSNFVPQDEFDDLSAQVDKNTLEIKSLEASGLWRGLFDTYADVPTKTPDPSFNGGEVFLNDYVIVEHDETHEGGKTRYMVTDIAEDGTITWKFFDEESGNIAIATNSTLGLVKGTATTPGKVSVDETGAMTANKVVTSPDESVKSVIKISYEDFKNLADTGNLIPDQAYDIIDNSSSIEPGSIAGVPLVSKDSNGLAPKIPEDDDGKSFLKSDLTWSKVPSVRYKTFILTKATWVKPNEQTEIYQYDVIDDSVTSRHLVEGHMDLENQAKMTGGGYIDSYDGGFKVITGKLPEEDIVLNVSISKVEDEE